jgi:hypothetical protein
MGGRLYVHRRYLDGPAYELPEMSNDDLAKEWVRRAAGAAMVEVREATVCTCGTFISDSSGDAGCGNCGADEPPEGMFQ